MRSGREAPDRLATAAASARSGPLPALRRLPLLAGALLALLAGLWGGLARLGTAVPLPRESFAAAHGPLMVLGFVGTLIALERAVALARPVGYLAPGLAALGAVATLAGAPQPFGSLLLTAAGGWLVAVYMALARRRPGRDVLIQLGGAAAWYVAGLLWLSGRDVDDLVPWFAAFLVLTIVGERLELARVAFLARRAGHGLLAAAVLLGAGAVVSAVTAAAGWRLAGGALVVMAAWLARYDVARRTVRGHGLPRFTAWCLLTGYLWLAVAGVVWLVAGLPTGARYDAALHALFLGFVISMIFGHAPVILPAVLRVALPYHPLLYVPLALLHVALVVRVVGDLTATRPLVTAGGIAGEVALLGFVAAALVAARLRPARATRPAAEATTLSAPEPR